MADMEKWQTVHKSVIEDFLSYLNKHSSRYILKGGTALMECYGLDRFSEDIDLDGSGNEISSIVHVFCIFKGYSCRDAKDTDTVKRFMVHYDDSNKPLKIEMSARRINIPEEEVTLINGIWVYNIDTLAYMKCNAYMGRSEIRNLYDLTFICNNYHEKLSKNTRRILQDAIANKGIEQFDYIVHSQKDSLIDTDKLAESFLEMYDKLGLLMSKDEREEIENKNEKDPEPDFTSNAEKDPESLETQYDYDDLEL